MYLILIGGGNVGTQLARRLLARGHEVVVLEKDAAAAQKLAGIIGSECVLHGDACDLFTQKRAGFARADVVIAVTGEDEDNLIACQMAKEIFQVAGVVARVNDPGHEDIFHKLGIDHTVSATGIIFNLIEQQISPDEMIPIGAMHKGQLEVVEAVLTQRSPLAGSRVRDVELPHGTFIVYLQRDGVGNRVDGDTLLQAGDTVVALVPVASAEALRALLCIKGSRVGAASGE